MKIDEVHAIRQREPVPLWLLALAGFILFFGGTVWWENTGGFRPDVYDISQAGPIIGTGGANDPAVLGARVFARSCAVCHLPTGQGVPGKFPPLAGSEWVVGDDLHGENHLVKIVLHGLRGPVSVRGELYNGAMAPWGRVLSDEQVAAVLTYIRSEWGNSAAPINAAFVAEIRRSHQGRNEAWTQKELREIPVEKSTTSPANPVPK